MCRCLHGARLRRRSTSCICCTARTSAMTRCVVASSRTQPRSPSSLNQRVRSPWRVGVCELDPRSPLPRRDTAAAALVSSTNKQTNKQTCERTYIVAITLQGSMASVGVAPEHLSVSGMMSLHSLTSLAMSLDLKDTVTSRYVRHRTVTPTPGGCRDVTHLECASEQLHDGIERYGAGGDRVESVA